MYKNNEYYLEKMEENVDFVSGKSSVHIHCEPDLR